MLHPRSIVILDCGGQYAHLIGSKVRRMGAFSEIRIAETPASELKGVAGIIISGGPQSVYEKGTPQCDPKIFDLGIPVLGLCYGHQWVAHALGGKVTSGKTKEYGHTDIELMSGEWTVDSGQSPIFKNVPAFQTVWMSHGDEVTEVPKGFMVTAKSATCPVAAMEDRSRNIYSLQFHVEVAHTEHGSAMLKNFVDLCKPASWSLEGYADRIGQEITAQVGDRSVFMLVSGGVDSTVAFTLLNKVLGEDRVQGLLVDTGLMRKGEVVAIDEAMRKLGIKNLHIEDASEEFFVALEGIIDPEEKRKRIGETFLNVQRRMAQTTLRRAQSDTVWLLGQGTIYPDTIETGGTKHADHIKTHHNRVAAVQKMIEQGMVIEPLKELYKDEVRMLGEELGLPHELVWRHPFPGPGLGVRILGAEGPVTVHFPDKDIEERVAQIPVPHAALPLRSVGVQGDGRTYRHPIALFSHHSCRITPEHLALATQIPNTIPVFNRVLLCTSYESAPEFKVSPGFVDRERADLLREANAIADEEIRQADLYDQIWQFPVVLLPLGLMRGGHSIVLRPIKSTDAMTANAFVLPEKVLQNITDRLMALSGIECVFFDLTNKPPATIEWE